jgi:hydroxymethylglutaryl-CoA lyase
LVPNLKGLERALRLNVDHIALFTAASETFNQKNIGMSIAQSLKTMEEIRKASKNKKIRFRIYVSTVFVCPFEGAIPVKKVLKLTEKLMDLKPDEISFGDTIGAGTPRNVAELIRPLLKLIGPKKIAVHFHDTRGTALANTLRAIDLGVRSIDSSAGGLGGCPFAPGATGNLATEDLVFMLHGMGVETGIDLNKLAQTSLDFCRSIGRPISSRYLSAYASSTSQSGSHHHI